MIIFSYAFQGRKICWKLDVCLFPIFFHVYAYFPYSVILIQSFRSLIGLPFVHSKLVGREVEDRIVWRFFKDDKFFFFFWMEPTCG